MRQGTTECWSRVFFLAPGQSGPDKSQGGSVQISYLVVFDSLWPHGLQHTRLPYASQLLELAQTHVPWVGNGIQPSHPLSSPSPPDFNHSSIRVFSIESALHNRWPKYWSFSFSLVLPMYIQDWFPLGSPSSQGTLKSSPTPQFKSFNLALLSFLYSPTLTSTQDYWKNHNFD